MYIEVIVNLHHRVKKLLYETDTIDIGFRLHMVTLHCYSLLLSSIDHLQILERPRVHVIVELQGEIFNS